jgi:flagellin-like hook-associated protein FlgL
MAIADVSLTSGMRSNLLQLQNSAKLIDRTQERLSTGKQVNSALDNPTNFFAAQAANNRAADFSSRKDAMGEAIQNVKAADAGVTAISSLVDAAKGLAEAALGTASTTDRSAFSVQFDDLLSQIDTLASDSGYRGTNLLTNQDLTVNFNEDASAKLVVAGFRADSTGLSIDAATNSWGGTSDITNAQALLNGANSELRTQSKTLAGNLNIITTRQNFTDKMIATLNTGADNLTLADMNQEGANMLMLQTRQSLGTTALSLSSQAAQSVLRLF